MKKQKYNKETILVHEGLDFDKQAGFAWPPVYRGSTVVMKDYQTFKGEKKSFRYGTYGNPSTEVLKKILLSNEELENGAVVFQSTGLGPITTLLTGFLSAGDHLLISDNVYYPTRRFCYEILTKFDVEVEFYQPRISSDIRKLIKKNTKLIYLESPGSLTFEIQDVPAIVSEAKKENIKTVIDNTWSSGVYFKPFTHGINFCCYALTKYFMGHSDGLLGCIISCNDDNEFIEHTQACIGQFPGCHEIDLCIRGMRSLIPRLNYHYKSAVMLAEFLENHYMVSKVYYPALKSHQDHELWRRDFSGAASLFSFEIKLDSDEVALSKMLDNMKIFSMGFSFGGTESLLTPITPDTSRNFKFQKTNNQLFRVFVGLENIDDLITDLNNGLKRYKSAI